MGYNRRREIEGFRINIASTQARCFDFERGWSEKKQTQRFLKRAESGEVSTARALYEPSVDFDSS